MQRREKKGEGEGRREKDLRERGICDEPFLRKILLGNRIMLGTASTPITPSIRIAPDDMIEAAEHKVDSVSLRMGQ